MEPTAERIDLPEGYGKVTTTMAWAAVREKLEQAPRYWLVTTGRDGRAHVVPVDGIWSLRPDRARAWSAFPTDVTRFVF